MNRPRLYSQKGDLALTPKEARKEAAAFHESKGDSVKARAARDGDCKAISEADTVGAIDGPSFLTDL